MVSAHEPPELQPIVARPSGSLVNFTLHLLFHQRQHLFLDELRVPARHGVVFQAALAALGVAAAVADRDGNHHGHAVLGDEIVERREQQLVGPVRPDDERRGRAGHVLLGDINRHAARVGSRMAGGHDKLCRIGGIDRAKRIGVPRDAGIDLAVGRIHREVKHRPLRHVFPHNHFRRGLVRRADDEVSVGIRRRNGAVGQFLGRDISRRVRIAGRRRRASLRGRRRIVRQPYRLIKNAMLKSFVFMEFSELGLRVKNA